MSDERCAWCGGDPDDPAHNRLSVVTCPEIERRGGGLIGRWNVADEMRNEIEALRGIVRRYQDRWWVSEYEPGLWFGLNEALTSKRKEPMTEAEQVIWYGEIVREEEPN